MTWRASHFSNYIKKMQAACDVRQLPLVTNFGCRPMAKLATHRRPASESCQGRKAREMWEGHPAQVAL